MSNSQRTLEIIAKMIGEKYNIKVYLEPDVHPHASVDTREIWLPSNVAEEAVFPSLALAIHEASHILHTTYDPEKIISNQDEFAILNSMEDARIDSIAFNILPNVFSFYQELFTYIKANQDPTIGSREARALADCIKSYEGFCDFMDPDQNIRSLYLDIYPNFYDGVRHLCRHEYDKVKTDIKNIMDKFAKNTPPPPPEPDPNQKNEQHGNDQENKKQKQQDQTEGNGKEEKKENSNGDPSDKKEENKVSLKEQVEYGTYGNRKLKTVEAVKSSLKFDAQAITDATRARFEEILKVKEEKLIPTESGNLNTDNLTAFFTEDIDELFTETKIQHHKKSKILLLLDCSGSMKNPMYDKKGTRIATVASAAKAIIESIEKVNSSEGICVDWDIAQFNHSFYLLSKDNWEQTYHPCGDTNLATAVSKAQDHFIKQYDIEGNKIIVLITDGEVYSSQISDIKNSIINKGSSIKMVIVGVGANPCGEFSKQIIDGRNILVKEHADQVLFEALTIALE